MLLLIIEKGTGKCICLCILGGSIRQYNFSEINLNMYKNPKTTQESMYRNLSKNTLKIFLKKWFLKRNKGSSFRNWTQEISAALFWLKNDGKEFILP